MPPKPGRRQSTSSPDALFLSWRRPPSPWDVLVVHLPLFLVAALPLLAAAWLRLHSLPLIRCTFRRLSGYPGPFCGLTRSFWAMAAGDWGVAFQTAPLGCLIYLACLCLLVWNAAALLLGIRLSPGRYLRPGRRQKQWLIAFVVALLLLNWVYRLASGLR